MKNSSAIRKQVEAGLGARIPGALTPQLRIETVRLATGVTAIDQMTGGGLPMGAVAELVGVEGSGRTSLAMRFVAARMAEGQVGAWVDATDALDPEAAAGAGIDLKRMLWIRCGQELAGGTSEGTLASESRPVGVSIDRSISLPAPHGGGGSPHPRGEGRGLPEAIGDLLGQVGPCGSGEQRNSDLLSPRRQDRSIGTPGAVNRTLSNQARVEAFPRRSEHREEQVASDRRPSRRGEMLQEALAEARWEPRCAEPVTGQRAAAQRQSSAGRGATFQGSRTSEKADLADAGMPSATGLRAMGGPWKTLDQALRATDLLLQGGGFGVIVLDLGSVAPDAVWRIPLATWFRFRAAAERTRCSLLLLTQHACARSSAELVLEMATGEVTARGRVMTGMAFRAEVGRQRFVAEREKVVSLRKPPQPERMGAWQSEASWANRGEGRSAKPARPSKRARR